MPKRKHLKNQNNSEKELFDKGHVRKMKYMKNDNSDRENFKK